MMITLLQLNSQRKIKMAKLIKCSTGGIDNKVIKRQDLKPMPTSTPLLEKLKQYKYFEYPMENFESLFIDENEKNEFYQSYFRENTNNIDALLKQPASGNVKINTFTSKKVLELYRMKLADK